MDSDKIMMFPNAGNTGSLDPGLLALLNQNGGFGGNGSWIWILFMWLIWGANGNNGFGNNNGTGFLSNQLNDNAGRDLLLQAINGRSDALGQLANIVNSNVNNVSNAVSMIQSAIQNVTGQIGITALQTQNTTALGNASISRQICECCCENRLAVANQTAALQSQIAAHDSNVRLQLAQNEAADQLSVCQQTNQLGSQADRNTNSLLNAIANQSVMINEKFCDLEKRELQNRINTQGDIITQLRGQISNDNQTLIFNKAIAALDDKIDAIAAKQPNTVPVQYPNLIAVNQTPYAGGYGFFGNGFGNNVVF